MINKKVKNATTHEYNGVKFKSGLELFAYKTLTENEIPFTYQPDKTVLLAPFKITFDCYEDIGKVYRDESRKIIKSTKRFDKIDGVGKISYTPDFMCTEGSWIMETKGFASADFPLRWKMFKKTLTFNEFDGILMKPTNQKEVLECINIIKNGKEQIDSEVQ